MTANLVILIAGGLVGAGIVVVTAGLRPARPDVVQAVRSLTESSPSRRAPRTTRWGALQDRALPPAAHVFRLTRYASDLRMVEMSPEDLAARKILYGLVGVAAPPVMSGLMLAAGVSLPAGVPVGASVALGAVFFLLPDVNVRQQAVTARASMRAATCVFLELVAMERLGDAGPTEALDRAAGVGGSREFARIRDALLRAELAGLPSWHGLAELAAATRVPELGDVADIMRLAGRDGAAVYATLRARAASLRTQLLATSVAKANAASEHMVVPVSLLGLCFMALLGYPAFVRILLA